MEYKRQEIECEEPLKVAKLRHVTPIEDTSKHFQNYVIEMVVEEKNVKNLMDVEELLHCYLTQNI